MKIEFDTLKKFVEGRYDWQGLSPTLQKAMAKELYDIRCAERRDIDQLCVENCSVQSGKQYLGDVDRKPVVGQELYTLVFANHQTIEMDVWASDEFQAFNIAQALIERGEVERNNVENALSLRYIKS